MATSVGLVCSYRRSDVVACTHSFFWFQTIVEAVLKIHIYPQVSHSRMLVRAQNECVPCDWNPAAPQNICIKVRTCCNGHDSALLRPEKFHVHDQQLIIWLCKSQDLSMWFSNRVFDSVRLIGSVKRHKQFWGLPLSSTYVRASCSAQFLCSTPRRLSFS